MRISGGWILEVDLRKSFDTLDHAHLRDLVGGRIRDGVVRRLIGKWSGTDRRLVGRVYFAHPCERLPALCTGHMVRGSRQTATAGQRQADPVRG